MSGTYEDFLAAQDTSFADQIPVSWVTIWEAFDDLEEALVTVVCVAPAALQGLIDHVDDMELLSALGMRLVSEPQYVLYPGQFLLIGPSRDEDGHFERVRGELRLIPLHHHLGESVTPS